MQDFLCCHLTRSFNFNITALCPVNPAFEFGNKKTILELFPRAVSFDFH